MSKKLFVGIDNGTTGTIGCIGEDVFFSKTPSRKVLKYTKVKANITRVDYPKLKEMLQGLVKDIETDKIIVGLERPMINSVWFHPSISAARAWETTLICLEELNLPYVYLDSKEWQRKLLPKGIKGTDVLKKASLDVGNRLFPKFKEVKHKDRDGLLIAEYLRIINT